MLMAIQYEYGRGRMNTVRGNSMADDLDVESRELCRDRVRCWRTSPAENKLTTHAETTALLRTIGTKSSYCHADEDSFYLILLTVWQ